MKSSAWERVMYTCWILGGLAALRLVSGLCGNSFFTCYIWVLTAAHIHLIPSITAKLSAEGGKKQFSTAVGLSFILIPFILAAAVRMPLPSGAAAVLAVVLMSEGVFWGAVYRTDRRLYNFFVFIRVLFPLLAGAALLPSASVSWILPLSPYGYTYMVIEYGSDFQFLLYPASQAVLIAVLFVFAGRNRSGASAGRGGNILVLGLSLLMLPGMLDGEEGDLPFRGYYRYGAWNLYQPPDDGGVRTLEAGDSYSITGDGPLMFRSGAANDSGIIILSHGGVERVIKGYRRLKHDERLTLWYGFNPPSVPIFIRKAGEYTFIILGDDPFPNAGLLENVDVMVIESYPLFLYAEETALAVSEWIAGGGTVVFTGRGFLRPRGNTVFTRFLSSEPGQKVISHIRKKYEEGHEFTVDEFYTIPAGLGRLIVFPADRKITGPKADFNLRENAWNAIGMASGRKEFPDRFGEARIAETADTLLPVTAGDFSVPGVGVILVLYCAGIIWVVNTSDRRMKLFAVLAAAAVGVILAFYRNADCVVSSVSIVRAESDSVVQRDYVLLKTVSFRDHSLEFDSERPAPFVPLAEGAVSVDVLNSGVFRHRAEPKAGSSLVFYNSSVGIMDKPVSWFFKNGELTVSFQKHILPRSVYLFSKGSLYSVPCGGDEVIRVDENDLKKITRLDSGIRALLELSGILCDPGQRFLVIESGDTGTPVSSVKNRHRMLKNCRYFIIGEPR